MTVQDLLQHMSGLAYRELTENEAVKAAYDKAGAFNPDSMGFDARGVSGDEQMVRLRRAPLARQLGTQWEYSLLTDVLDRIVEKVSGQRLGDFLEERVFGPLQMQNSGFHVPENAATRLYGIDATRSCADLSAQREGMGLWHRCYEGPRDRDLQFERQLRRARHRSL